MLGESHALVHRRLGERARRSRPGSTPCRTSANSGDIYALLPTRQHAGCRRRDTPVTARIPSARSEAATAAASSRDFLGHPRGLAVLFATETWERFSYFGNAALVVLYMVEIPARARPGRERARLWRGQGRARIPVRTARAAAARLAAVRLLYRACLFHADPGRAHRRPPARPAPHRHHRRRADGDRPFHDGVRGAVPGRAR